MSGLFGTGGGGPRLAAFDFSVLGDYYQAKAQLRLQQPSMQSATKSKSAQDVVSFAPWDQKSASASDVSKLRDALTATSFINLRDASFDTASVDQEHRKLFALYQGLARLQAIATRASEKNTPEAELTG